MSSSSLSAAIGATHNIVGGENDTRSAAYIHKYDSRTQAKIACSIHFGLVAETLGAMRLCVRKHLGSMPVELAIALESVELLDDEATQNY